MRKSSKTKEMFNPKLKIMIMNYGGCNLSGADKGLLMHGYVLIFCLAGGYMDTSLIFL